MTTSYQNTAFESGRSVFTDAQTAKTQVVFTARNVSATTPSGVVQMRRAKITLRREAQVSPCGTDCTTPVTESVSLEFNVNEGATNLSALRTELNRLVDEAVSAFNLTNGLVPPSYATFTTE